MPKPSKKNTTRCRSCQEKIRHNAKKCPHCGSYQDWRRFVYPYLNLIGISVAVVSLIIALWPLIKEANSKKDSELSASIISFGAFNAPENKRNGRVIGMITSVYNTTDYPAYLSHLDLRLTSHKSDSTMVIRFISNNTGKMIKKGPNQSFFTIWDNFSLSSSPFIFEYENEVMNILKMADTENWFLKTFGNSLMPINSLDELKGKVSLEGSKLHFTTFKANSESIELVFSESQVWNFITVLGAVYFWEQIDVETLPIPEFTN